MLGRPGGKYQLPIKRYVNFNYIHDLWPDIVFSGFGCLYQFPGFFDFPSITVEGSFTTGGTLAALLIVRGCDPLLSCTAAFAAGMVAGALTGLIHTRFGINPLLSGILVMTTPTL